MPTSAPGANPPPLTVMVCPAWKLPPQLATPAVTGVTVSGLTEVAGTVVDAVAWADRVGGSGFAGKPSGVRLVAEKMKLRNAVAYPADWPVAFGWKDPTIGRPDHRHFPKTEKLHGWPLPEAKLMPFSQ